MFKKKFTLAQLFIVSLSVLVTLAFASSQALAQSKSTNHPFCKSLHNSAQPAGKYQASSGAQMFCFGAQTNSGTGNLNRLSTLRVGTAAFGANVDAASFAEDITTSGVRAYGQAEVSVANAGHYVVEGWNDSTGFYSPCPSANAKEELTGFGFSNNGGASFTDMGGTPVTDCNLFRNEGDPAVEAYTVGGHTYFYITQITIPLTVPENGIGLNACQVIGTGVTATLSCNPTILAAISSDCVGFFCSFLDKEFITIDPQHKRLYISYTEFGVNTVSSAGQVEVAECDITNPIAPVCSNGSAGTQAPPYLVVANGDPSCESEGSYPNVDNPRGDLYVGYEFNWATNLNNCETRPTQVVVNRIPRSCLLSSGTSSCSPPFTSNAVNIVSMDAAFIPGYNRFPMNDFPRIAVSHPRGTVSLVWNDTRANPAGDILMQSFMLGSLAPVQAAPVTLNNDAGAFNWHFLPAVRQASSTGLINVSWYDRRNHPQTAITDVFAALSVDPTTTSTPESNARVTDMSSDWNAISSDIIPNFGDYTDNYLAPSGFFVAWSDGRIGDPQPYVAKKK